MIKTNYLRIPMQMLLYDVRDVDAFAGLPAKNAALLWTEYSEEEIRNIVEALQFAADHPDLDFVALMPDVDQSNDKIHLFLCKVLASIRQAIAQRAENLSLPASFGPHN